MNETALNISKQFKLKPYLVVIGLAFLLLGLGLTLGIVYLAYMLVTQADQLSALFAFINAQEDVFVKWIINSQADEIEFSRIIAMIFIAISFSIVIQVVIALIRLCISSGTGLLNTSRNFDN